MFVCVGEVQSYDDHGQEGKAHEDTLHLDEQHGARQFGQHCGVEAGDHSSDGCSWQRTRKVQPLERR